MAGNNNQVSHNGRQRTIFAKRDSVSKETCVKIAGRLNLSAGMEFVRLSEPLHSATVTIPPREDAGCALSQPQLPLRSPGISRTRVRRNSPGFALSSRPRSQLSVEGARGASAQTVSLLFQATASIPTAAITAEQFTSEDRLRASRLYVCGTRHGTAHANQRDARTASGIGGCAAPGTGGILR